LPEIGNRMSQRVDTDSVASPHNLGRFMSSLIDSGDTKPKLFEEKRKTEFNIYEGGDHSLFETNEITNKRKSSLVSPGNVRRGKASSLDR
jgi:hypothetical protein